MTLVVISLVVISLRHYRIRSTRISNEDGSSSRGAHLVDVYLNHWIWLNAFQLLIARPPSGLLLAQLGVRELRLTTPLALNFLEIPTIQAHGGCPSPYHTHAFLRTSYFHSSLQLLEPRSEESSNSTCGHLGYSFCRDPSSSWNLRLTTVSL